MAAHHVGCYIDADERDLDGLSDFQMIYTSASCVARCKGKGFAYAGVQNGGQCFCGDSYGKHGRAQQSDCNDYLAPWRNNIYKTGNPIMRKP